MQPRFLAACLLASLAGCAQLPHNASVPHLEQHGTAKQLIVDGRPFLAIAGEVRNSSSSSLAYMQPLWPRLAAGHLNTVLTPVSWELIEPREGVFDFTLVDGLIEGARRHNLHLAFLWFGSWKNMVSSYAPAWVRAHPDRFACAMDDAGDRYPILSTFSDAACQADAAAFAALMHHIAQVEAAHPRKTVLMMQVENEVGLGGGTRDHSPQANQAFAGPVPREVLSYLREHKDALAPELLQAWQSAGSKTAGSWAQLFGAGPAANQLFMSWQYARYIDKVAAAGKNEYPIPMFVNASVGRQDGKAGTFPAGGPVANDLDVWHAAAPHLDLFCPDIYYGDFDAWCRKYTRTGDPLFIPEMRAGSEGSLHALTAIARYNAIGVSPFAIEDSIEHDEPYHQTYSLLPPLAPLILQHQGDGSIAFVELEAQNTTQKLPLGPYIFNLEIVRARNTTPEASAAAATLPALQAYALIIHTAPDEYFVAGKNIQMTFSPTSLGREMAVAGGIDEGSFTQGRWIPGRRLNGDETMLSYSLNQLAATNQTGIGARFGDTPTIDRITLLRYPASAANPAMPKGTP